MNIEDGDIDIDLDAADLVPTPERVDGEVVVETPPVVAKPEILPEEGLEKLKADLEAERAEKEALRQGKLEAEAAANQSAQREHAARTETQESQLSTVTAAISNLEQASGILKSNYSAALQAQDFDAAAEINDQLAEAKANLIVLRQGKQNLEAAPKPQVQQYQPQVDPVEALCSQLQPKSAAWVRQHPECARDPALLRKMGAAHELAVAEHPVESDGYFARVEELMGYKTGEPIEQPQRRAAPSAAPVSRSGTANGSRPNVIRLTAAQREAAADSGLTDKEYAIQLLKIQQETAH